MACLLTGCFVLLQTLEQNHSEWAFGAVAELLDNSKDAGASLIQVDLVTVGEYEMLRVKDDGSGMTHEALKRCLQLSHEDDHVEGRVGMFGVGFKSGTMALGNDAIILTKDEVHWPPRTS